MSGDTEKRDGGGLVGGGGDQGDAGGVSRWAIKAERLVSLPLARYAVMSVSGAVAAGFLLVLLVVRAPWIERFLDGLFEGLREDGMDEATAGAFMGGLLILFGVFVANLFRRGFDLLIARLLTRRINAEIDRARYGDAGTPEFEAAWRDEVDRANGVLSRTEELGTLRLHLRDGRVVAAFGSPFGLLWIIVLAVLALYVWLGA